LASKYTTALEPMTTIPPKSKDSKMVAHTLEMVGDPSLMDFTTTVMIMVKIG
jgi:hypothetical protein